MSFTTGEVIATPNAKLPFKVIFRHSGKVVSRHDVKSKLAGDNLVASILTTLRMFETA